MKIEVKTFATLRKVFPNSKEGKGVVELPDGATIEDLLAKLGITLPQAQMVLINGQHQHDYKATLHEGDTVSIFPPLAGGSWGADASAQRHSFPPECSCGNGPC
jgi:molybdopterin converting factor small subunit